MTTQVAKRELLLVYDGGCPMCTATVSLLQRCGLVTAQQAVSNHDLSPEDLAAAKAAGIRNQLVVLDPRSRATRTGVDGLLWIVGENRDYPLWVRVASLPLVRPIVRITYEAIAYNRRIISPPRHAIRCDCEPQATLGRRLMLVAPLLVLTAAIVAAFGAAVYSGLGLSVARGASIALATFGVAALMLIIAAAIAFRGEQRIDYLAHQAVIVFTGALLLTPAIASVSWLLPLASVVLAGLSVLASFAVTFAMQTRRLTAVGLSGTWRWFWGALSAVSLGVTAFLMVS